MVFAALLLAWLLRDPAADVRPSVPGMDGQPEHRVAVASGQTSLQGLFTPGEGSPSPLPGAWPRFRGANFDNRAAAPAAGPLDRNWRQNPPVVVWTRELGEGHAAPAVRDGRVFVLDYDETAQADTLRCLALDDGREIWRRSYAVPVKRNHGLSRTIPAVSEKYVLTLGPRCHVVCLEKETGNFLWGIDLQARFGTREPFWYAGQCPLIDDDVAVIAMAGTETLLAGFDCASGDMLWQTPNEDGWQMSHSSVMPMRFGGRRSYVYCAIGGIVAVAADGDDAGRVLWKTAAWQPSVVAPSPVVSADGLVFVTAGYGAGSALLRAESADGAFAVAVLDIYAPKEGLACEQQTPILKDGFLYGIMPKDAGALRNQFVCAPLRNPRDIRSTSGREYRFGLGPFLLVDDLFLILNDDGTLVLADASPDAFRELGRAKLLDGRDAWGPMALAGDRLLIRDDRTLACIRLPVQEIR